MTSILHTKEQGLRVHKLANLGGLVAIAGLENIDPAVLLGAFLEMAEQLPALSLQRIEQLQAFGMQKLRERKSEKQAYRQYQTTPDPKMEVTFNQDEIRNLIIKLDGKIPVLEKDLIPELYRLMR